MSSHPQPSDADQQVTCPRCNLAFSADQPESETPPTPDSPNRSGTVIMVPGTLPPPAPTPTPSAPPTRIGRFEIKRFVGEGMFGRVYQAYDPSLKRVVALKVARPEQLTSENRIRRFQREAQNAAVLLHPHIVALFDSGQDGNQHYIASAFIDGKPLDAVLEALPEGQTLPLRETVQIVRKLAEALAYAHKQGVIHRDLKPGNVMLGNDGEPLVMDFGLATRSDEVEKLTHDGSMMGTPAYMAPEQWKGKAEAASDQYSLGCMLFELLTARLPFVAGSTVHYMHLHCDQPAPSAREVRAEVPRDLETICQKCLEKEPRQRYRDCQELADDLRRFLDGEPTRARPIGIAERVVKWSRRRPAIVALLGLVLAVAGAGFAAALDQYLQAQAARREAAQRADREAAAKDEARQALGRAENDLYFASLTLAQGAWRDGNLAGFRQSLDQCPPALRRWEWHHLDRRSRSELLTLTDGQGPVSGVAFSPGGDRLAAAASDGAVRIWDAGTGRLLATLGAQPPSKAAPQRDALGSMAWSPDGTRLVTGGDRFVRVWTIGESTPIVLGPHTGTVFAVAHYPTRPYIAAAVGDLDKPTVPGQVVVWDLSTGKILRTLPDHKGAVYAVAFNPDGSRLASGGDDMTAILWDMAEGKKLRTYAGHHKQGASPSGSRVMRVQGPQGSETVIHQYNAAVFGVAFSPDGQQLVTASGDGTLKLWETAGGKELHTLRGHGGPVGCVAFSPSGRSIVSGSMDRTVRLWSVTSGRELRRYLGHSADVAAVAFGPRRSDGTSRLATASADGSVKVWDPDQSQESYLWRDHPSSVFSLAFAPDSRTLAAGNGDLFNPWKSGTIRVFDLAARHDLFTLPGHKSGVGALAYSPDGKQLASGAADGTVKLWDLAARRELREWRVEKGMVSEVAFSPDGTSLAAANASLLVPAQLGAVEVWDLGSGERKQVLRGHEGGVTCFAYSPDGRYLATGSPDRTVQVWDLAGGRNALVQTLRGHPNPLLRVCWSPDGQTIAAGGGNLFQPEEAGEVRLWDVASGTQRLTLKGHTQLVNGVVFTADGERVVTGSRDATVKLWDARTGRLVLSLPSSSNYICSTAVSRDGRWVAAGNWGTTVNLWEGETEAASMAKVD